MDRLHDTLRRLYDGHDRLATQFRYALVAFDVATILFFIITATMVRTPLLTVVNVVVGLLILCDIGARLWIARDRRQILYRLYTIADAVVILSVLLAPFTSQNLGLFRVLRGLRLVHSYRLLHDLRRDNGYFRENEETIFAAVNLFVFLFVVTSLVYVARFDNDPALSQYIDALYFTVATLTTTGYGDITLDTPAGKLLSVFIMLFGAALFVRLARAIFQPSKIRHQCRECGLSRHDVDAVHCKHCGIVLKIETEGSG